jgi:hypothetical protein
VGTLLPIFAKEDPYYKGKEDEWENWENAYLPEDEEELRKMNIPRVPLLLDFPHIHAVSQPIAVDSWCSEPNRLGFLPSLRKQIR